MRFFLAKPSRMARQNGAILTRRICAISPRAVLADETSVAVLSAKMPKICAEGGFFQVRHVESFLPFGCYVGRQGRFLSLRQTNGRRGRRDVRWWVCVRVCVFARWLAGLRAEERTSFNPESESEEKGP